MKRTILILAILAGIVLIGGAILAAYAQDEMQGGMMIKQQDIELGRYEGTITEEVDIAGAVVTIDLQQNPYIAETTDTGRLAGATFVVAGTDNNTLEQPATTITMYYASLKHETLEDVVLAVTIADLVRQHEDTFAKVQPDQSDAIVAVNAQEASWFEQTETGLIVVAVVESTTIEWTKEISPNLQTYVIVVIGQDELKHQLHNASGAFASKTDADITKLLLALHPLVRVQEIPEAEVLQASLIDSGQVTRRSLSRL